MKSQAAARIAATEPVQAVDRAMTFRGWRSI